MFSAAASQGLVWRWDIDSGLAQCDRFLYVNDDFIKVLFEYIDSSCLQLGLEYVISNDCDCRQELFLLSVSSHPESKTHAILPLPSSSTMSILIGK